MSVETKGSGTSIGRAPSMSISRPSSSMGRERGSYSSFSIAKSGNITEKGGPAMKMKVTSPMTRENGTSFKNMPVLKAKGVATADRAMPKAALRETRPLVSQPSAKERHPLWAKTQPFTSTREFSKDVARPSLALKDTRPLYQSKAKETHSLLSTTRPFKLENRFSNDVVKPASGLKETKPQYQKPKENPWKNTMELKINKQSPAVAQADFQRKEKLPDASAPSLFEHKAGTKIKTNYPNTAQAPKKEAKKLQSTWEKVQQGYALKKAEAQGQPKPDSTKDTNIKPIALKAVVPTRREAVQFRTLAPKTTTELAQRAKDARTQTKESEVRTKAQTLQQEYRKKFALPERQSNPVTKIENKITSQSQGTLAPENKPLHLTHTSKDPVLARVEAEKVMEQAALVLNAAAKFDKTTSDTNVTHKLGQERILQLVHETLQKRGLTQYMQETKASQTQKFEKVQQAVLSPQQKVAVYAQTEQRAKAEVKPEAQPAAQAKLTVAEQSKQRIQTLPSLETEQHITPELMPEVQQEQSVATQTAVKAQVNQTVSAASDQAMMTMPQEEVVQRLEETLAIKTQTSGAVAINQHVKVLNGQYVVEREEVVVERDPEADSQRVQKAVEVGADVLSQANSQGLQSISSEDVVVRMPSSPIGGLVSRIRKQLNLSLDTENQYDAFKHVLRETKGDLRSISEVQSAAKYATDIAPAVRLNTRLVTEPVSVDDHIRAVSDGTNIVVFEQRGVTAQAA